MLEKKNYYLRPFYHSHHSMLSHITRRCWQQWTRWWKDTDHPPVSPLDDIQICYVPHMFTSWHTSAVRTGRSFVRLRRRLIRTWKWLHADQIQTQAMAAAAAPPLPTFKWIVGGLGLIITDLEREGTNEHEFCFGYSLGGFVRYILPIRVPYSYVHCCPDMTRTLACSYLNLLVERETEMERSNSIQIDQGCCCSKFHYSCWELVGWWVSGTCGLRWDEW